VTGRRGGRRKQLPDGLGRNRKYWNLEGETLDHAMENSLWKRLWTCRKSDCWMNERQLFVMLKKVKVALRGFSIPRPLGSIVFLLQVPAFISRGATHHTDARDLY
jgi:hypothetical protein